mmetsp:Transcript_35289/g.71937  ORF Transcript_35289/g.71937 Transcript_35289/m.71937 type:complete len:249 (+) Transcript_35289:1437-2183(+)
MSHLLLLLSTILSPRWSLSAELTGVSIFFRSPPTPALAELLLLLLAGAVARRSSSVARSNSRSEARLAANEALISSASVSFFFGCFAAAAAVAVAASCDDDASSLALSLSTLSCHPRSCSNHACAFTSCCSSSESRAWIRCRVEDGAALLLPSPISASWLAHEARSASCAFSPSERAASKAYRCSRHFSSVISLSVCAWCSAMTVRCSFFCPRSTFPTCASASSTFTSAAFTAAAASTFKDPKTDIAS